MASVGCCRCYSLDNRRFAVLSVHDETGVEKNIKVIAEKNQLYVLPDSTKVWMQPGSSIRYAKAFMQDRRVWLEGSSLFEVRKQEGSTFQVYIYDAFIEVKGTCFVKQHIVAK